MNDRISSIRKKRILFSPLNWGWGHVTRSFPLIHRLINQENELLICCNAEQEKFYRSEFPNLWYVPHEGYPFHFSGKGNWEKDLLKSYFKLNKFRKNEELIVRDLVAKFHPSMIISDQRYGFLSSKIKSVFVTHQLQLPSKHKLSLAQIMNKRFINRFDEVWVPDMENSPLSGKLSVGYFRNKFYLGIQSRLAPNALNDKDKSIKYLGVVSGPKPYDQLFFDELVRFLSTQNTRSTIVVPASLEAMKVQVDANITLVTKPDVELLNRLFDASEMLISRAGYSTLMDLKTKGNKAILIPTPGQAEQNYLATLHANNEHWQFVNSLDEYNFIWLPS